MQTLFPSRAIIVGSALIFALSLTRGAQAQPETAAPTANKPKKDKADKKMRGKNLPARTVTATETALGKPLTPELKAQLTQAFQARQAAIEAANEKYYADFAALTGLSVAQVRSIDKPNRGGKNNKLPTTPQVETQTDNDQLTTPPVKNTMPDTPDEQ